MMLKLWIVFCLCSFSLYAYPTLQKMEELLEAIKDADERTLVVFDIDYTLTVPSEAAFHMALVKQYKPSIKEWIRGLTEEEKFWLAPYIVIKEHSNLIEKETPSVIASLQQRGIKTLALTACPSANLPSIGNLAEWRERELKSVGIDFSKNFTNIDPFMMKCFKEHYGCYPGFYKGILFCNFTPFLKTTGLADKGEVLRQFSEHVDWKPERIIMIDDDEQNLDHFALAMQKWGVDYLAFHYTGAENVAVPHLTEKEIQQQWGQLIQQLKENYRSIEP